VLAHAIYLPSASCFALMPLASQLGRTGSEAGCSIDYDANKKAVVVTTPRMLRCDASSHACFPQNSCLHVPPAAHCLDTCPHIECREPFIAFYA
jgi:hypothetical protein